LSRQRKSVFLTKAAVSLTQWIFVINFSNLLNEFYAYPLIRLFHQSSLNGRGNSALILSLTIFFIVTFLSLIWCPTLLIRLNYLLKTHWSQPICYCQLPTFLPICLKTYVDSIALKVFLLSLRGFRFDPFSRVICFFIESQFTEVLLNWIQSIFFILSATHLRSSYLRLKGSFRSRFKVASLKTIVR
jgi:hypothetical protein